jgi:hypothetical protein
LNEYLPAPRNVDWDGDGVASPDDEWIELYNRENTSVDLGGWQLDDVADGGTSPYPIPPDTVIPARGVRVFFKKETGIALNNAGDTVRLIRPDGVVAETHSYTNANYDESYAKTVDGGNEWTTTDSPSPGSLNGESTPTPAITLTPTPAPTATATPTPVEPGAVLINEVVTDPQQDWNDSTGGNGIPFDTTPGNGTVSSSDEWIELLNVTECSLDLTGWSLVMSDTSPATQVLGEGNAVLRFSNGGSLTDFRPGERLVIGNPKGALNNDVYIELRDATGRRVDDVEIGDDPEHDGPDGAPQFGQDGNATTAYNEAVARVPDGVDTDDDIADFTKGWATIGAHNGWPVAGRQVHLPILNVLANGDLCQSSLDIQNVGREVTKAVVLFWAAPGACPPQCAGPVAVVCSGLLRPGAAWHVPAPQVPATAMSATVFSAFAQPHPAFEEGAELFADALCQALAKRVVGDCDRYRRFKRAFDQQREWDPGRGYPDFDFGAFPGEPLAVQVTRQCTTETGIRALASYAGLTGLELGQFDAQFGGFAFYAPLVYGAARGLNTFLYVQNAGVECTSVELWFRAQERCRRATVCQILSLAPGETYAFDVNSCVPPGFVGSVWVRTSERAAIAVDTVGDGVLMTWQAQPAGTGARPSVPPGSAGCSPAKDDSASTFGSQVNYGPLIYREFQGWDTTIQVQNLSATTNARVKVYFLDRAGSIITSVVDWICPRGSQTFFLPVINNLPGNFVGQVRVESQEWFAPSGSAVAPSNIVAVTQLIRYGDPARTRPLEAMAYVLFPEQQAFDWQHGPIGQVLGLGAVGRIAVPGLRWRAGDLGLVSEIALQNVVPAPGFTDAALFFYDQNGLLDLLCETLNAGQVESISLDAWGYVNPGFRGSVVISAVFWEHPVLGSGRNLVGLAAVKIERRRTVQPGAGTGDEATATRGVPVVEPGFQARNLPQVRCP